MTSTHKENWIALLETLFGFPLEELIKKAVQALPQSQRIVLQTRFGLEDGIQYQIKDLVTSWRSEAQVRETLQDALMALGVELQDQHAFSFLSVYQESPKSFIRRIQGTDSDIRLFENACDMVFKKRILRSKARMMVLFRKKGIGSLSELHRLLPAFGKDGRAVCEEIIETAIRQEALL